MSELSIFTDKASIPSVEDLESALGVKYQLWESVVHLTYQAYPDGKEEWNYPGKNYGWSFRIKDKRRAILYFLPRQGYFKVAFIFGDKAVAAVMASSVPEPIKTNLREARKYAEGRGVQLIVETEADLIEIKKLIEIKLAF
jgi:hypothetical protein